MDITTDISFFFFFQTEQDEKRKLEAEIRRLKDNNNGGGGSNEGQMSLPRNSSHDRLSINGHGHGRAVSYSTGNSSTRG